MSLLPNTGDPLVEHLRRLVPGASLIWQAVPGANLKGLFIEPECANRPLSPQHEREVMESPPFWSLLWPSGFRLCRMLGRISMDSRYCVDLGCGSGLVAAAASARGARRSVAADCDPLALQAAQVNAAGNGQGVAVTSFWTPEPCDTLLLADFLYDEENLPLLYNLMDSADEVAVMDCRLRGLDVPGFQFLGSSSGVGVPDLDPSKEFGTLRFWYRGPRLSQWQSAYEATAEEPGHGFALCE